MIIAPLYALLLWQCRYNEAPGGGGSAADCEIFDERICSNACGDAAESAHAHVETEEQPKILITCLTYFLYPGQSSPMGMSPLPAAAADYVYDAVNMAFQYKIMGDHDGNDC